MQPGEVRVVEEGDFIAVLQLNSVTPAAETGPDAEALKAAIAAQVQQALAGDLFAAYSDALISATPVVLDQNAISAVNSPAMMLEPSFEVFRVRPARGENQIVHARLAADLTRRSA